MKIIDLLRQHKKSFSFEFFPPKTEEGFALLYSTIDTLKALQPSFVSVTYGAMGSTRKKTVELVSKIKNEIGLEAMAHITCLGHNREEIYEILKELEGKGIENVLALRGDPPQGEEKFIPPQGGFRFASQLIRFIKASFSFCLGAAGYPEGHIESPDKETDLQHLKEKVEAGADFIITQLFFDNQFYFDFVEQAQKIGITCPILPGIMPVLNFKQIQRFTKVCGATLPPAFEQKLQKYEADEKKIRELGIAQAIAQCRELLKKGAPGIHFYTLNRSDATFQIYQALKQENLTSS